jgi:hypothetical protein
MDRVFTWMPINQSCFHVTQLVPNDSCMKEKKRKGRILARLISSSARACICTVAETDQQGPWPPLRWKNCSYIPRFLGRKHPKTSKIYCLALPINSSVLALCRWPPSKKFPGSAPAYVSYDRPVVVANILYCLRDTVESAAWVYGLEKRGIGKTHEMISISKAWNRDTDNVWRKDRIWNNRFHATILCIK